MVGHKLIKLYLELSKELKALINQNYLFLNPWKLILFSFPELRNTNQCIGQNKKFPLIFFQLKKYRNGGLIFCIDALLEIKVIFGKQRAEIWAEKERIIIVEKSHSKYLERLKTVSLISNQDQKRLSLKNVFLCFKVIEITSISCVATVFSYFF